MWISTTLTLISRALTNEYWLTNIAYADLSTQNVCSINISTIYTSVSKHEQTHTSTDTNILTDSQTSCVNKTPDHYVTSVTAINYRTYPSNSLLKTTDTLSKIIMHYCSLSKGPQIQTRGELNEYINTRIWIDHCT